MSVTPKAVFRSLSDTFRTELLKHCQVDPTDRMFEGDFDGITRKPRDNLEHELKCIALLGSDYAAQLLHDYLSDAGWNAEDFEKTQSHRDRACALLCYFPIDFANALAVWNANRMRGRLDREQGFRLPDLTGYLFSELTNDQQAKLEELIRTAVTDAFPAKVVTRVEVFQRSAHGLPTASKSVLQCDVSIADDRESIIVVENGERAVISFTRLSSISAIIDPEARSLFVGTQFRNKPLHKAVAKALVEILFKIEETPEALKPLRVYPELCKEKVDFRYSSKDGIARPRISELRYRLYSVPSSVQFSVREEDPQADLHGHPDVQRHSRRMRVWRAAIEFVFNSKGTRPPLRRQVTLSEPDGISFGGAFPEERLVIERVLSSSKLIDDQFDWQPGARFTNLARLIVPQHIAELRQTWQPLTVKALEDADILVPGGPHARAWCRTCCETHEMDRRENEDGDKTIVLCPVKVCELTADHVDTLVLSEKGLLIWLQQNATQCDGPAERIGSISDGAWLLGQAAKTPKGKSFQLILAIDVDRAETANALNEFLLQRHPEGPGLILSLHEQPVQKVFPSNWRAVPLSAACEAKQSGLIFKASSAWSIAYGKKPPKKIRTDEDWDAVHQLFLYLYPGTELLVAYRVANEMIAARQDICDMTPEALVPKLRSWAPDRFRSDP